MPKPRMTKAQLEAAGSWRAAHRETPTPAASEPEPLHELSERELYHWNRVVEDLTKLGAIADTDGAILTRYCELQTLWESLRADIVEHGAWFVNSQGNEAARPAWKSMESTAKLLVQLESLLGLSPAARSRIDAKRPEDKSEDELGEFLRAPTAIAQ